MLNTKQQEAYTEVLNGTNQVVILTGAGGTGKSHTVIEVVKHYPGKVQLTASTNKAKDNLAQMAEQPAKTIQSFMGFVMVKKGYTMTLQPRRNYQIEPVDLLVVDEASMLPKVVFKAIQANLVAGNIGKVLLLGDDVQLEAVGEGVTLDKLKGAHIQLIDQMRQVDVHKDVVKYLNNLRQAIIDNDEKVGAPEIPANNANIVFTTDYKEFATLYNEATGDKKCIAYRNNVVDKMNTYIRGDNTFNVGDDVIVDAPIQGTNVKNGDMIKITDITPDTKFNMLHIKVISSDGQTSTIQHWEAKAEFEAELAKARHIKDEEKFWLLTEANVGIKHLYAATCYKAQGSSYSAVFIDGTDIYTAYSQAKTKWNNPIKYGAFLRMLYVSLSRMRTKAVIFIGDTRKYQYLGGK